jgi:hypothetical protein
MVNNTVTQVVDGIWAVTMEWSDVAAGGPSRLVIEPVAGATAPPAGLSSTVLREVDFRASVAEFRRSNGVQGPEADSLVRLRKLRAAGISQQYLAALASVYLKQAASTPKAAKSLAEELGMPLATLRGHLWKARREGLLDGSPGRVGGTLTDKAKDLLAR